MNLPISPLSLLMKQYETVDWIILFFCLIGFVIGSFLLYNIIGVQKLGLHPFEHIKECLQR